MLGFVEVEVIVSLSSLMVGSLESLVRKDFSYPSENPSTLITNPRWAVLRVRLVKVVKCYEVDRQRRQCTSL